MSVQEFIEFSQANIPKFKAAYSLARTKEKKTFIFEGKEFVTDYAKYVIEYIDLQFNKQQNGRNNN